MYFTNPQRKESNFDNKGAREWVLLFLSKNQETSCPERHERDARNEMVHHLVGRLPMEA
jgi:hypothetical protein